MIKTSHAHLNLNQAQTDLLDQMCDLYTKAKHTGFKLIAKNNVKLFKNNLTTKDIVTSLSSEQRKLLATQFNLTGRHVNSINIELGMIISAYVEQRNTHLADLQYSLTQINKSIAKYNKTNLVLCNKFPILKQSNLNKQINVYQQFIIKSKKIKLDKKLKNATKFIFNYKNCNLPSIIKSVNLKSLLLTPEYKHIDSKLLVATQSYGKNLFQLRLLNQKLSRLKNKITKIENDINQGKIRICFGTKALFNQQNITANILNDNSSKFNAQSVLFKDHIDWLTSWYDSRSHQFLITGAGEESSGNQNCNAHLNDKSLFNIRLRLPDNLIKNSKDKFLTIKDVDFGKNNPLLQSSLSSETKEVKILTIAEKAYLKELKNTVFELKKSRFSLIKEIRLLKKSNTATDKRILKLDNEIIKLQKEIEFKSDIFTFNNNEINEANSSEEKDLLRTRKKKVAIPITYRFVKNTERNSPKYGKWSVHFTVEVKEPEIITDISLGSIGVDLNENHLAVTEVDSAGKLIQSFNIYFNPETYNSEKNNHNKGSINPFRLIDSNNNTLITLAFIENQFKLNEKIDKKSHISLSKISTDKTHNILGNAIKIVTDLSLRTGKPIIIEKLDFTQKKKQLVSTYKLDNKKFNYNHMISSFAYSKFKELLKSQAARSGLQVIEVNPAYSSLIGLVNYVKPLGLSIHMSASYVIAQRGLNKNTKVTKNKLNNYKIDEKPRIIKIDNKNKLEIYTKSKVYLLDYIVNSNLTEDIPDNEWSVISNLYKTLQKDIYKENLQHKKLTQQLKSMMKSLPALSDELDLSYLFSEDNLQVIEAQ
jgi:IS605 OrfB family transposase